MDGFELLDESIQLPNAIRERYKVFVLSSTDKQAEIQRLHEKPGFEGFVPKPLTAGKPDLLLKHFGAQ